jgi:hypothetical protein
MGLLKRLARPTNQGTDKRSGFIQQETS